MQVFFSLNDYTRFFLVSCLVGAGLGALYDFFRVLRVAVWSPKWIVVAEDLLYFILCAVITFLYMAGYAQGQVRGYILIGELLGWILYYFTIGKLVIQLSKGLIRIVRAIVQTIWKVFTFPFRTLWKVIRKFAQSTRAFFVKHAVFSRKQKKERKKALATGVPFVV